MAEQSLRQGRHRSDRAPIGRLTTRTTAALLALTGLVGVSGCAFSGISTTDVYADEFLGDLRDTLQASDLVLETQVEPEFYERPQNVPPQNAAVELAPGTEMHDLQPLLVELTALASQHGEEVPRLDFAPLPDPAASLTFSGSVDATQAEDFIDYLMDGNWMGPVIHVSEKDEPRLRVTASVESSERLLDLVEVTAAPLPTTIPPGRVFQWLTVEQPHMVTGAAIAGEQMSEEFMTALLAMDATDDMLAEGMPLPSIDVGYASSSDGYIHRPSLTVRVDAYDGLERDEIRQRGRDDGYGAMCERLEEIIAEVPELQTSTTDCKVNSVRL